MEKEQTENFARFTPLAGAEDAGCHIHSLLTDLGEKNLYDAVSQCNRCNYCATVCPTQSVTGRENLSGRGRNQLVRMLLEGRLKTGSNAAEINQALFTCLLCGACTATCYAKVPTADIVLEARRSAGHTLSPFLARIITKTMNESRPIFASGLRLANLLKKAGLSRLAGSMRLYDLFGMPGLGAADREVERTPLKFLFEILRKDKTLRPDGIEPAWLYFAPCGPNYLYPEVGLSTVRLLKRFSGDGFFFDNTCCGLLDYNYGRLEDARSCAKKIIERYEHLARNGNMEIPVVGDCASCIAFMKTYEQLFTDDPLWRPRAARFAEAVKDILEFVPGEKVTAPGISMPLPRVTYHDSCRACHGQGIRTEPRRILKKILGDKFVEFPESDWCCGGAGAFAFTQPDLSSVLRRRKINNIASARPDIVLAGGTSCLIQIAYGLKKYYPRARVMHYSEFLDKFTSVPKS